ncbi:MAG: threonine/serine exporter family protein [Planctomycetes bacterium]|nr:threonine/serine exporter family protein [Planctomycetota bacterium]
MVTPAERTPDAVPSGLSDAERFLVELARDLHRFGTPAHRLEEQVTRCGARLGVPTTMFSLPTFLALAFGPIDRQRVVNLRVDPGAIDLTRLHAIESIQSRVLRGETAPQVGAAALRDLGVAPPTFNRWEIWAAYGLAGMAATRFFGGDLKDAVAGAIVGLLVGGLSTLLNARRDRAALAEFLAGIVATVGAWALAQVMPPITMGAVMLAGIVVLLPGFTLTRALIELATRNLASGSSRFMGAAMTLVALGFGAAIGDRIVTKLPMAPMQPPLPPLGWLDVLPAALVMSLASLMLLQGRWRDLGWVAFSALLGLYGARLGAGMLGPELGVCVGAFLVGIAGNAFSRLLRRPAITLVAPGILPLVPGSLGLRGTSFLFMDSPSRGASWALAALVIAGALVAGLLAANVFVPPRRSA